MSILEKKSLSLFKVNFNASIRHSGLKNILTYDWKFILSFFTFGLHLKSSLNIREEAEITPLDA